MTGRALAIAAFVVAAAAPLPAHAQADNSNSFIEPERAKIVVASATSEMLRALPRWLRDDPRRRERLHALGEGLTAAELGLLYGVDFTTGATADWPAPAP